VTRLATVRWFTPPPTGVDEELAIYDDGVALLAVRVPRALGPSIGTYRCPAQHDDAAALSAAGSDPIMIDLLAPRQDGVPGALASRADRLAASALENPLAVATFHAGAVRSGADRRLSLAVYVVASGERAVEFELDPSASSVQFSDAGQPLGWLPLTDLATGFVTADAVGLGGLRRRAIVEPGAYGSVAFEAEAPEMATSVGVRVCGWLSEALPDDQQPARFEARTAESPIMSS
jgi:hypothetical protein